jgi:hypothetical protein
MKFKQFILMEQDPAGGGNPLGDMGGNPLGDMGGNPLGDMGGNPTDKKTQPVPQHANVWDVLDSILNKKEIKKAKPAQIPELTGGGGGGAPPMGGGAPPMGGGAPPMGGGAPPMGGGVPPMGGGAPL